MSSSSFISSNNGNDGFLLIGVFILLLVIAYFMINNMVISRQYIEQHSSKQPYCFHSKYGCCPLSPTPRENEIGSNCQ